MPDKQNANSNEHPKEFSIYGLLGLAWRKRKFIVLVTAVFAVGSVAAALLSTPIYEATASLLPQDGAGNEGFLGTLAAMSGTPFLMGSSNEELYLDIIESNQILNGVLEKEWPSVVLGRDAKLYEIFDFDEPGDDPAEAHERRFQMRQMLRETVLFFHRDHLTGFMVLKVRIPRDPVLAATLANDLVQRLDEYNRSYRSGKAVAHREYVQSRLDEVGLELELAQLNLVEFEEHNHGYEASPALAMRQQSLAMDVQAKIGVWVELSKQIELVTIEENQRMISLDVLDPADPPVRPISPKRRLMVMVSTVVGFLLSLVIVFVRDQWTFWGHQIRCNVDNRFGA